MRFAAMRQDMLRLLEARNLIPWGDDYIERSFKKDDKSILDKFLEFHLFRIIRGLTTVPKYDFSVKGKTVDIRPKEKFGVFVGKGGVILLDVADKFKRHTGYDLTVAGETASSYMEKSTRKAIRDAKRSVSDTLKLYKETVLGNSRMIDDPIVAMGPWISYDLGRRSQRGQFSSGAVGVFVPRDDNPDRFDFFTFREFQKETGLAKGDWRALVDKNHYVTTVNGSVRVSESKVKPDDIEELDERADFWRLIQRHMESW